jgi:hypothetical protein
MQVIDFNRIFVNTSVESSDRSGDRKKSRRWRRQMAHVKRGNARRRRKPPQPVS